MAQVKKFQDGSGVGGIQPSKLRFKINGQDYEKDEQFLKDQFEPMFKELVDNGDAKPRDRDLWRKSFQQYVGQAKSGTYSIDSSSGKFLNGSYVGDSSANLGIDEDGNSARKTEVGELISRRSKNDEQRMSMLNSLIGTRLAGAFQTDQDALTAKTKADADKLTADEKAAALNKFKTWKSGYGQIAYGAEYSADPKFTLGKYWDKNTTDRERFSQLSKYRDDKFRTLFDPSLDKYKNDINSTYGIDLDAVRTQAQPFYDPTTGKMKVQDKHLKDFSKYSNLWDAMITDEGFYNKKSYDDLLKSGTSTGTASGSGGVDVKSPNVSTDVATDKAGAPLNGWHNNLRYDNGKLYDGYSLGPSNDYLDKLTGTYLKGKMVAKSEYDKHYDTLSANPENVGLTKLLDERRKAVMDAYTGNYGEGKYVKYNSIRDTDGDDFLLKALAGKRNITDAVNATEVIPGLAERGGALAQVKDENDVDHLGNPKVLNVLRLPSGQTVIGRIRENKSDGSVRLYYNDDSGKYYTNPDVTNLLKNLKLTGKIDKLSDNFRFNPKGVAAKESSLSAAGRDAMMTGMWKSGGKIGKLQVGGSFYAKDVNPTAKRTQNTVGGIAKAVGDPSYNMSEMDKWELGALAGDLAGVTLSLTGAGSIAAGTVGIGSTLAQGVIDYKRDGNFDLADAGRLGVGLALDAATFVPGLGVAASGSKTLRTLTKVSKWIIPALTAAGMANAAMVVGDVVSGRKKLTDLSVDDLRGLVNGIHGVMGGSRMLGQKLATKNATERSLTLKNGTKVTLDEAGVRQIEGSDDKIATAKSVVARLKGIDASDVKLTEKTSLNPKFWNGITKSKEVATINTDANGKVLKNIEDYQGNGWKDTYMRGAIRRAGTRDPSLVPGSNDENKFGYILGDYFKKSKKAQAVVAEVDPDQLRLPAPSGKPTLNDNQRKIAQESQRRDIVDLTDPQQLRDDKKRSDMLNKMMKVREARALKRGVKFQWGGKLLNSNAGDKILISGLTGYQQPLFNTLPDSPLTIPQIPALRPAPVTGLTLRPGVSNSVTAGLGTSPLVAKLPALDLRKSQVLDLRKSQVLGAETPTPHTGLLSKIKSFASGIDPNTASELARALLVRNLNSKLDTRVERPMIDAPSEVSIPVRGNLLAQTAFNDQANSIIKQANSLPTSDASLHIAANLQAGKQAAGLRLQGDVANVDAIERTRGAALENDMRGTQIRSQVANQNKQTLARATQAERAAENDKFSRMNQPIVDFWKDQNYKNSVKTAQDAGIDTQIALQSKAGIQNTALQPLMQKLNANQYRLSQPGLTPEEAQKLNDENALLDRQAQWIQQQGLIDQLKTRKDLKYKAPEDWYTKGIPFKKEGGEVKVAIANAKEAGNNSRATVKQQGEMIENGLEENSKKQLATMKQIQDLIKLALS